MGNSNYRQVFGPIYQGAHEQISYTFDWSSKGIPGSPVVTLEVDQTWISASLCFSGSSPLVSGCTVTSPIVYNLVEGTNYRLSCRATFVDSTYEVYGIIMGEH